MKKGFSLNEKRLFFGVSSLGFIITLFCLYTYQSQLSSVLSHKMHGLVIMMCCGKESV